MLQRILHSSTLALLLIGVSCSEFVFESGDVEVVLEEDSAVIGATAYEADASGSMPGTVEGSSQDNLDTSFLFVEIVNKFKEAGRYANEISVGQEDLNDLSKYSYLFLALVYFLANKDLTFSNIVLSKMSEVEQPLAFDVNSLCEKFKFPESDVYVLFQFLATEKNIKLPENIDQHLMKLAEKYQVREKALNSEDIIVISWLYEKKAILPDLIKHSNTLGMRILEHLAERESLDNTSISHLEEMMPEGESFLRLAAKSGRVEMMERLSQSGFNITTVDKYNKTALEYAVEAGHVALVKYLESHGAKLDGIYLAVNGGSLTHIAAFNGRKLMVEYLLGKGLNPDALNSRGQTPLYMAASRRHEEVVKTLRQHGADVDRIGLLEESQLHIAAKLGDVNATEVLIANGATVDSNNYGMTPLYRAAQFGQKKVMAVLLENSADKNYGPENRNKLIHVAARNNHSRVIEALLELGVHVDTLGSWDFTPLHWASRVGFANIVQLLLDRGANIEARIDVGRTPLHEAAFWGQIQTSKTLVANGADVRTEDSTRRRPSQLAKDSEHFALYLMLKELENKQ